MFRFTEPSSGQFLKTQHWYIQRIGAIPYIQRMRTAHSLNVRMAPIR